jgi:hypothetical protein
MTKVLLSIAAVATLAAAVPAMAQPFDPGHGYGPGYGPGYGRAYDVDYGRGYGDINRREREIAFRIERGQRDGSMNWREARRMRWQLARIEDLEQRYRFDGLSGWERADLNRRLDRLSFQLHAERHDGDSGSGSGRGWGDHDRDGRW